MSESLAGYKMEALNQKVQAIRFDKKGNVLESDNCIFSVQPKENLAVLDLFFESLPDMLVDETDFPVFFPSIEITWKSQLFTVDLTIHENEGDTFLLLIEDRTSWYEELRVMQQERNEKTLDNHQLEHKNRTLQLEREILKLKNNEMQRLQTFKSEFFSKVSHELRTPISGIIGLSNLLENVRSNSKDKEKYLKSLKTSANHLQNIVNDVLDMSKIEAGKFQLNNEPVNLPELIEDVVLSFYYQAKEKGLELKTYIANNLPTWVNLDATRVKQILFNLLSNAMKFTKQGHLALHTSVESTNQKNQFRIDFKVEDTGIGIPANKLESIFKEYEQVDKTTQTKYGGTGLGLSVVHQLVNIYGGDISVSSIEGEGSIFSFHLMVEKADDPSKLVKDGVGILYTKLKVLVADDDPINLMILKRLLEESTQLCTVVNDGEDVQDELQKHDYDLLISDVNMPGKTGVELAYELKDAPIKVFLLSGDYLEDDHEVFKDKVVEKAFLKPVSAPELFDAINELF